MRTGPDLVVDVRTSRFLAARGGRQKEERSQGGYQEYEKGRVGVFATVSVWRSYVILPDGFLVADRSTMLLGPY